MDSISAESRSANMRNIRGKNTKPELIVRKAVFAMGYRYRLHAAHLPGKPDLVFPSLRKVIFVHGCFWHMHSRPGCKIARLPKSNTAYWLDKLERNVARDVLRRAELRKMGWKTLVVWECQICSMAAQTRRIKRFLEEE